VSVLTCQHPVAMHTDVVLGRARPDERSPSNHLPVVAAPAPTSTSRSLADTRRDAEKQGACIHTPLPAAALVLARIA
jgi:hypothetical protein